MEMSYTVKSSDEIVEIDALVKKYGIKTDNFESATKSKTSGVVEFREHRSFKSDEKIYFSAGWNLRSVWTHHDEEHGNKTLTIHVLFHEFKIIMPGSERPFQLIFVPSTEKL